MSKSVPEPLILCTLSAHDLGEQYALALQWDIEAESSMPAMVRIQVAEMLEEAAEAQRYAAAHPGATAAEYLETKDRAKNEQKGKVH